MHKFALLTVWLFVFIIPWENMFFFSSIGTIGRAAGLITFVVTLFAILIKQENLRIRWLHWIFLVFVLWSAATFFWSVDQESSYSRIKTYFQLFFMVFLVFQWVREESEIYGMLEAFVLGCWVAVFSTFKNFYSGNFESWERIAATGFNPNDMAIIMVFGLPMAWYLGLKLKAKRAWIYRLYPLLAPVAVGMTASRGGLIIMIIALLFVVSSFPKISFGNKVAFVVAWGLAIGLGYFMIPAESLERWSSVGREITQGSLNTRLYIWEAGLKVYTNNPLFGIGAGAFRTGVEPQLGSAIAPHNVYLSILVEQGIIGLVIFLAILGGLFEKIRKMAGLERLFLMFLLIMWMVSALSLNWEWRKQTWILFTLTLAHIEVFYNKDGSLENIKS